MNRSDWTEIIDAVADGVLVADAEDRIVLLNPAAEALTGWSAEEALGRPWSQVLVRSPTPSNDLATECRTVGSPPRCGRVIQNSTNSHQAIASHSTTLIMISDCANVQVKVIKASVSSR